MTVKLKRMVQSLCAITLLCGSMYAQTTATLQGTVTDPGDAAVPGATVEIRDVATGVVRSTTSTAEGLFRFNSVTPAVYSLTIKAAAGFKTFALNDLGLTVNEVRELGRLKLEMGAVTEQIQVTAQATPVQTSSSENSKLVEGTQVTDIAIRGGDMFAILQTVPGVYVGNNYLTQGTDETTSETGLGTVRVNGTGSGRTNFQVDGVFSAPQSSQGTTDFEPSMNSIAEIRVLTTNYQAEYGRNNGGVITVVTKSGSQQFHGGAQANKRHEMFNAKNFFTNYKIGRAHV